PMPIFWVAIAAIWLFSLQLGWLPVSGRAGPVWEWEGLRHIVLPAATLATTSLAIISRLTRSGMLDVLGREYVTTARAKGVPPWSVVGKHALKNALIPVLTVVAPHDPIQQDLPHALAKPSAEFPLGTDQFGRCILSRIVFGARQSLLVGVIATAIGASAGILLGLLAGYFPRLDGPVMRTMDVLLAFPSILLDIAVVAALGPSLGNVMIAVGVRSIPSFARVSRSMVLSLKELDFVRGALALGASHPRVLFRHILPNSVSPLLVFSSMQVAT